MDNKNNNNKPGYTQPITFEVDIWKLLPDWLQGAISSVDDFFSADERKQLEALQELQKAYKREKIMYQLALLGLGGLVIMLLLVIAIK